MDRRSSDNNEPPRRRSNPDVFDDDYEIDPNEDDFMPSVSDGFRPTNTSDAWHNNRQDHDRIETPQRQQSTSKPPNLPNENDLRRTATRNSTAKVQVPATQDGRPPLNRGPSHHSPLAHRDSVSSTASFATTSNSDNPFETGPSHPYGMYPQLSMARPLSVATTSTERQPHRSMSLQRPTHPYAMYSQSGIVDEESPEEPVRHQQPPVPPVQAAIPVGFPGLNNGYHRVLGPDGEEQDIIGPDGHTEQLPPYSQYPDEGPTKASLAAAASASRIVPAPLQVDAEDPSIFLQHEDPFNTPPSPVSPLSATSFSAPAAPAAPLLPPVIPARLPPQRPETQTGHVAPAHSTSVQSNTVPAEPSDSSSASLLATENGFSEKAEPAAAKVKWRKRKLWGKVPVGVALVVLILILVFAVALGAAIGTVVAKKHGGKDQGDHDGPHDQPQPQVTGRNSSLFDAVPIPTPVGLSPLPTGPFALPLGIPQESNPGCLTQANQYSAWSCKMTFAPLVLTINDTLISGEFMQVASMERGPSVPNGAILYGLQTPDLDLKPMELVLDLDYKAYGPAYHFSARYDKLVILPPEELNFGSGLTKRQSEKFRQRFEVKPGDSPWYCYWNHTYIEGYIYAEDNSTAASLTSFPTQWPMVTSTVSGKDVIVAPTAITVTVSGSDTTSGSPQTMPATITSTPSSLPSPVAARDAPSDTSSPPRMPPYPRIVKIEERRLPDSPQPYCQQMVLLDNGEITSAPSPNDSPIRIWLQESDPGYDEYATETSIASGRDKRQLSLPKERRSDPSDACHCQWMFK
jgi:hypothetical protein